MCDEKSGDTRDIYILIRSLFEPSNKHTKENTNRNQKNNKKENDPMKYKNIFGLIYGS